MKNAYRVFSHFYTLYLGKLRFSKSRFHKPFHRFPWKFKKLRYKNILKDWNSFHEKNVYVHCITVLSERYYPSSPKSSEKDTEAKYYFSNM